VKARGKTWRDNWLAVLRALGYVPLIRLLQTLPLKASREAERYWIKMLRSEGCRLTNTTAGGDGVVGYSWPAERRLLASLTWHQQNRAVTEATRAKMAAATRRQMQDPAQRAAVSRVHKGKTISLEHRKRVSEATKLRWARWRAEGGVTSVETRAKISAARKGKPGHPVSAEAREKIAASKRGKARSTETRARISASRLTHFARLTGQTA
jgi:hypothetical protein